MPIAPTVTLGEGAVIHHPDLVNLYGCSIGAASRVGAFVEIQKGVTVGARCKVSSHTFICEGVTVDDDVFIGFQSEGVPLRWRNIRIKAE